MKNKTKIIVKVSLIVLLLITIGFVFANDLGIIRDWSRNQEITKPELDLIKETFPVENVKIKIELKCKEDYCYYSANQKDLINIKDERISRIEKYCSKEETIIIEKDKFEICREFSTRILSEEQMEEIVSNLVKQKTLSYAESKRDETKYNVTSSGYLNIKEKK